MSIKPDINVNILETDATPDAPLLRVLGDHLGMTGPRFDCGIAQCGACTVHINGAAETLRLLLQVIEMAAVVFLGVEAHGTVVAALNDVPGGAGQAQAGAAGHGAEDVGGFMFLSFAHNVVCPLLSRKA